MKVWFEADTLYYDLPYNGIETQFIHQPGHIIESINLLGDDVHVKSHNGDYIVFDISKPTLTRLVFSHQKESEPNDRK